MRKPTQRLLVVLLGLALVCMVTAQSHWLMAGLFSHWLPCCHALTLLAAPLAAAWLSVLTRGGMMVTLGIGMYLMLRRLWHSYSFLVGLHLASAVDRPHALPRQITLLCTELGLTPSIVVLPTQVPLAFCFGLLRPRICVSTGLLATLTDKELKAVLLHESHHQRHYDPLRTLVVDGVAAMLFFLPIVAEWRDLFRTATELAADRYAISTTGRSALAGALYKLLTHPLAMQDSSLGSGVNGLSATEARLAYLLEDIPLRWHFSPQRLLNSTLFLLLLCMMLQISSL